MQVLIIIVLGLIALFFLSKGWIWLVNSVMNPLIKWSEREPENIYVSKHFRILEGNRKAHDLQESFLKGKADLNQEYEKYLKWCKENNTRPVAKPLLIEI